MTTDLRTVLQISRTLSADHELLLSLLYTAELIGGRHYRLIKEHGLQPAQYNVLRILRGAGEAGLPCSAITERMITQEPDMTRLIDRLVKQGLVSRRRGEEDRRVVFVVITEAGLASIKPLDRILPKHMKEMFVHLAADDKQQLIGLLERVRTVA